MVNARTLRLEPSDPVAPDELWPEGFSPKSSAHDADAAFGRLLDLPASAGFRYPWPTLDAVTGGVEPGGVVILQARTGNGKTTFTRSLVDICLAQGRRTYVLATESRPGLWRGAWACLRAGEPPGYWTSLDAQRDVEAGVISEANYRERRDRIEAARADIKSRTAGEGVYVEPTRFVTVDTLRQSYRRAQQLGAQSLLIDHIDLVRPANEHDQAYAASRKAMDLVLEQSQDTGITTLVCSQTGAEKVKGPILSQFDQPTLGDSYMGQHKNHHATHVLGLFRPRRGDAGPDVVRQVNAKQRPKDDALEPNRMGVVVNKNRNYGNDGAEAVLAFDRGRIRELDATERHSEDARVHAIRTNRDL